MSWCVQRGEEIFSSWETELYKVVERKTTAGRPSASKKCIDFASYMAPISHLECGDSTADSNSLVRRETEELAVHAFGVTQVWGAPTKNATGQVSSVTIIQTKFHQYAEGRGHGEPGKQAN